MATQALFVRTGLVLVALLLTGACGGDTKSTGGSEGADSTGDSESGPQSSDPHPPPEIISRTRGGSSFLTGQQGGLSQLLPPMPGITVRLTHRETLPAEEAFAVAFFVPRSASGPNVRLSAEDEAKLRAALTAIGIKADDITLANDPRFGPQTNIRVRVPLAAVTTDAKKVFAAITDSIGSPEQTGVQFALRDCASGLNGVRQSALSKAKERANSIARAGELNPGAIIAVLETPGTNPYGPPADDPCDPAASFQFKGYGSLLPVDSKPQVDVVMDIAVTFALANGPAGQIATGINATGSGAVTAKANEAYVVVLIETFSGPTGPRPIADRDRQAVIDALKPFGVTEEDIEFFSAPFGGPTLVSVETDDLTNLAKFGDDVSDAVEELLGRSVNQGVVFSHSNCEAAKSEARKEAMHDARAKAEGLAAASGSKLGTTVRMVAEASGQNPYGPPAIDPCDEDLTFIAQNGYGSADIKPFNARPEFTVRVSLNVLYATE